MKKTRIHCSQILQSFQEQEEKDQIFYITTRKKTQAVPYQKILYFESRDKRVYVRTEFEEIGFHGTLSGLETELQENFIRCHKGYLVNKKKIQSVDWAQHLLKIFLALDGTVTRVCSIQDLNLLGRHNYENVMAAVLMAVSIGIPMDSIRHSLSEFRAVEHRIEFVEEKNGVAYYNDSKGTNVDAAIQAIRAMIRPTVLLGGGYDKGAEFDEWIQAFDGKVKQLILMGATARQIADTAAKYGVENIVFVDSMEEAVQTAAKTAEPGDAVLLSPACASWGMFPNYEVRGRVFKELVHAL